MDFDVVYLLKTFDMAKINQDVYHIGKHPDYKYVYVIMVCGDVLFTGRVWSRKYEKQWSKGGFRNAKDAAVWVDKKLIEDGREPINILKRR